MIAQQREYEVMNMRVGMRLLEAAVVTGCVLVVASKASQAYVDPGTGSYVLQVMIASILAAAFLMKSTWHKIRDAVVRRFVKRAEDDK
jgi:hydrogenase-4 membrane subunit HyfE